MGNKKNILKLSGSGELPGLAAQAKQPDTPVRLVPCALPPSLLLLLCLLFALGGCSSRVSTHDIRQDLTAGNYEILQEKMQVAHNDHQELVTALNLGRVLQMQGQWQESINAFESGQVILEEYEGRARINLREIFSETGSVLLSRGSRGYYGTGYERSLLHTFNAINYMMLGDFSGAAVEMRKMEERQELWLAEESYRLEKHLQELNAAHAENADNLEGLPAQYTMAEILQNPAVRSLASTYQDSFSYALSAVLCRLAGDSEYAAVSLRRAAMLDNNAYSLFEQAWFNKNNTRKPGNLEQWQPKLPPLPSRPGQTARSGRPADIGTSRKADYQEVTVIFLEGLAPALRMEQVRVPAPFIGYLMIDLPAYTQPLRVNRAQVRGSGGGLIELYPLLHTELLAYRNLRDEVRYEMGSAISRAITRAVVAGGVYAAAASNESTEAYAPLLSLLTSVAMDLFASSTSESVRNWETLPASGGLGLGRVKRGEKIIINVGAEESEIEIPAEARGMVILLSRITNSRIRVDYVSY